MQKTINVEAKLGLRSNIMIWDSDTYSFKGHRLSSITCLKVQTQGTTAKKPHTKKCRHKKAKQTDGKALALPRSNKPIKLNRKEKKKEYWKKKQDQKSSSLTTKDNTIEDKKGNRKCYNCQKRPYFEELPKNSKKLVSILATFMLVIDSTEKVVRVPWINYPIYFQEIQEQIRVLLDSGININTMSLTFAWKLVFYIWKTNIRA